MNPFGNYHKTQLQQQNLVFPKKNTNNLLSLTAKLALIVIDANKT